MHGELYKYDTKYFYVLQSYIKHVFPQHMYTYHRVSASKYAEKVQLLLQGEVGYVLRERNIRNLTINFSQKA